MADLDRSALLSRRDILQRLAWTGCVALGGAGLIVACDDGDGGSGGSGGSAGVGDRDCSNGAQVVYIRTDHDHSALALSGAQITAAVEQDYTLLTGGGHTHAFRLTAADFGTLALFGTVTVRSNGAAGHDHDVRITC